MTSVGPAGTLRVLQTELVVVQAQLTAFEETQKELRSLIAEVMNFAEDGGAVLRSMPN
jgi:prefoldin subunit 5